MSDDPPAGSQPAGVANLESVLFACLEAPEAARDAAFTQACGRHPQLAETLQRCWQRIRDLQQPHAAPAQVAGYRILRRLGGGGMGVVYLAEQEKLGRKVAIKLIRSDLLESEAARERFHREALAASRLEHPGICPVFEVGEADGGPFMVMPWLEGTTLSARLAELRQAEGESGRTVASSAARRDLVSIVASVARAAHHAHEHGLVHRDIKPANIMLLADGRPMLLDFGLARDERADATLTRTGERVGTPAYMAPEQIRAEGATIDRRTDVYALGIVLYEVLRLAVPFRGSDPLGLREQILSGIRPASLRHGVPRDLASIILKATDIEPARRYATAADLADDLDRFARLLPVHARRIGAIERTVRWIRRHPVMSGLLFALAGALVFAGASLEGARSSLADFHRMADIERVQNLLREANEELWPLVPSKVPAMERWLAKVEELAAREPLHRRNLKALELTLARPGIDEEERETALWQRDAEVALLATLSSLLDADWHKPTVTGVRKRIEDARRAHKELTETHARRWADAIATIADRALCPLYDGLRIEPQLGLVPLGRNEVTGLYEFWHPASGEQPKWSGRTGQIQIEDATGMVFVLLPGGVFWMGAQRSGRNADRDADVRESPVHQVALDPFFLARHEMTQGQWQRWTGENPSQYRSGMPTKRGILGTHHNPVEQVSWDDCHRVLGQMGLDLPTEAQWEYGCRAGTETVFWTGNDVASLKGKANIADEGSKPWIKARWSVEKDFDDGYAHHAPVGSFAPNSWGLFDVHGNVWEWCRDSGGSYEQRPRPGDGQRDGGRADIRKCRGGSCDELAISARSASRDSGTVVTRAHILGVRAARALRANG